jgi:hypothetical protein
MKLDGNCSMLQFDPLSQRSLGVISRAVVDHNQALWQPALAQYRLQRQERKRWPVEHRHDHSHALAGLRHGERRANTNRSEMGSMSEIVAAAARASVLNRLQTLATGRNQDSVRRGRNSALA